MARDRVFSTLATKKVNSLENVDKILCFPSDLSREDLGLPRSTVNTLQNSLTTVIHCAWAVNFNLGVQSFEKQHIKGTFNLLNTCLKVNTPLPAKLFFCSSISAAAGTPLPATISETYISDLTHAQSMGYARSKLVTESIIKAATEQTGMIARVLRVGQIVGDTRTGLWNSTEAISLMIRSAVTIGALPALEEVYVSRYLRLLDANLHRLHHGYQSMWLLVPFWTWRKSTVLNLVQGLVLPRTPQLFTMFRTLACFTGPRISCLL